MSKITHFNLFPTPVTHWREFLYADETEAVTNFCLDYETCEHNMLEGDASCSSGSTRPLEHTDNILGEIDESLGIDLYGAVESVLDKYANEYGIQPIRLTNSWFNIQDEGSQLRQHNHPFSVVSAALFVNIPSGSNRLYFENPNPHVEYNYRLDEKERSRHLHEYWHFEPQSGDLVIFPSWLKHGSMYEKNNSTDRLVISVNAVRKTD
tara:strand:- start:26991 stop:27614 length:624 start_codon:yes stop_codon:yes gene_type:complete